MLRLYFHFYVSFFRYWPGAIFDEDDFEAIYTFEMAISRQNVFNPQFDLEAIIKKIASMDGFRAEQAGLIYTIKICLIPYQLFWFSLLFWVQFVNWLNRVQSQ